MTATLSNLLSNNYDLRVFCDTFKRFAVVDVEEVAKLPEIGRKALCKSWCALGGDFQVVAVR